MIEILVPYIFYGLGACVLTLMAVAGLCAVMVGSILITDLFVSACDFLRSFYRKN